MAMAWVWTGMVAVSVIYGALNGTIAAVGDAALEGAGAAVELCLTMAGILCLWSGVMAVMEACGLTGGLSRLFRPLLSRLLPKACRDPETLAALSGNVSCNLLGLGNAATPAGLRAMERMAAGARDGRPTAGMCMFLLVNASSLQLVPTTVLSLRAAAGAPNPGDILLPALIGSAASTLCAVALGKLCERLWPA